MRAVTVAEANAIVNLQVVANCDEDTACDFMDAIGGIGYMEAATTLASAGMSLEELQLWFALDADDLLLLAEVQQLIINGYFEASSEKLKAAVLELGSIV